MNVLLLVFIIRHILKLLVVDHDTRFRAVSDMDLESGMLSLENFKTALSNIQRHPKLECIKGLRIYIFLCWTSLSAFFVPPISIISACQRLVYITMKRSKAMMYCFLSSSFLLFSFFFLMKINDLSRLLCIGTLYSGMHEEVGS